VAVHSIGKFKTIAQLVAIPMLLFNDRLLGLDCVLIGRWLIVLAAVLTVWSMFYYLRRAWPYLRDAV
jgi:phosphatidylglycerophosphate synthase